MMIAIYTLTDQRDKFIDGLLADELRKYGHEVVIRGYIYGARESICYEKPDVIIHPMPGGQYKMDTIEKCKEWGVQVIVRRGEAGMGRKQFDELDKIKKSIILGSWDYSPYVDLELVWGQEFADIITEQGHMPADKIKVCGAFAFDPYFQHECRKDNISPRKPTVLFATGFSTADCRSEYVECGIPEDSPYHGVIHKQHCDARDVWLDAIERLVKDYSEEWAFELKVRPGESIMEYIAVIPKCVKIHPEDAPSSVVLRTVDVLIHSGSTLAIEAHLLGIPSFNFIGVNPDPLLSKISPSIELYKELEFALRRSISGQSNIDESVYHELQQHLYGKVDGKACQRAAEYINENIKGKVIENTSPTLWPKTTKYLTDGVNLKHQEGDYRWTCPCCRNVYWAEQTGVHDCPYCSMKVERTMVKPSGPIPSRTNGKPWFLGAREAKGPVLRK